MEEPWIYSTKCNKSIIKNHIFALLNLFHMQNMQIYTDSKLVAATFGGGSDGDIRMRL